jgi:hypothetical protein
LLEEKAMNQLLLVLGFWEDDASRAESLLDWMYQLNRREKQGHALILAAPGTHGEMHEKIKISCDLAFESYQFVWLETLNARVKPQYVNQMILAAATIVHEQYSWSWLWIEPDCIPLKQGWLAHLSTLYHDQPKRYLAPFLLYKGIKEDSPDIMALSRVGVYPNDAVKELESLCALQGDFNRNDTLTRQATKTSAIQTMRFDGDASRVRKDSVLLHGDKEQQLIAILRKNMHYGKEAMPSVFTAPPKVKPTSKIDGRTKEARALKEAKKVEIKAPAYVPTPQEMVLGRTQNVATVTGLPIAIVVPPGKEHMVRAKRAPQEMQEG